MLETTAFPQSHQTELLASFAVPPLPIVSPIIGREEEIEQTLALLDGDGVRVVSLLGPGGVGKTRLALELTRQVGDDFAHGVCFVPLAPVREYALVPFAVAQTLGIQESGVLPITDLLAAWLRPRHFMLVLDNMEQVIAAASPWLVDLLAACPRLKVVATSRIALDIIGEQRFRVPTLPVPAPHTAERLDEYASIALFAQRAHAVRSDFVLDSDNSKTVAEICVRLDGLPLAIELAAARINVFSPAEILARLTDRMTLLAGRSRDAPPRLRSMRDAIGWSFDLLSTKEQELFCRLAVFAGGFSFDAAGDVAASRSSALDTVVALIDQSMVERVEGASEPRFRMLETIREFGLVQLADRGQLDAARDAHAAFCRHMGDQAEAGLKGPNQAQWLWRLDAEYGNLREALAWLTASDRIPEAVELLSNIGYFMLVHAHFTEWRQFLDGWFAMSELHQPTRTRALALFAEGFATVNLGEPASAIGPLEEALELFRELGDAKRTVFALNVLTFALESSGDAKRARVANEEALPMARQIGETRHEALALVHLANISWQQGEVDRARQAHQESLAVAREAGDSWMIGTALNTFGQFVLVVDRDMDRATELFQEARNIAEDLGDKRNLPVSHLDMAVIARIRGDFDAANAHLQASLSISRDTGHVLGEATAHLELGITARLQHELDRSLRELHQSIRVFQQVASLTDIAGCLDEFAALALATGDARSATRFLGASAWQSRGSEALQTMWLPREHDRLADEVRGLLGEETYALACAEAQRWSVDDAMAAALAFELPATHAEPSEETGIAHGLSPRELDVLKLMANGLSNQQIADELYLSRRTVTSHITSILGKLDFTSRTQAVSFAIRSGIA